MLVLAAGEGQGQLAFCRLPAANRPATLTTQGPTGQLSWAGLGEKDEFKGTGTRRQRGGGGCLSNCMLCTRDVTVLSE